MDKIDAWLNRAFGDEKKKTSQTKNKKNNSNKAEENKKKSFFSRKKNLDKPVYNRQESRTDHEKGHFDNKK